jgi:hypothetical protein
MRNIPHQWEAVPSMNSKSAPCCQLAES